MAKKIEEHKPGSETLFIESLVDAFTRTYHSVACEEIATDVFTMGRLREYFNAYLVAGVVGDPLVQYIEELANRNYLMRTSFDGNPGLFVRYQNMNSEYRNHPDDDDDE